jgi:sugar phosphate isomerase/epimerase
MKRRDFIKSSALGAAALASAQLWSVNPSSKKLKISLAQWSLHRAFNKKKLDPVDFASIAKNTYNINAVEYVNGFYTDHSRDERFWMEMRNRASGDGVKSLLMMVDDEGDLGITDDKSRRTSVENHFKWVNAASILGCHTVRVNAFGEADRSAYRAAIVDGMGQLAEYAAQSNLNIVIENHGLFSSDASLIAGIVKEVNMPNFGTFPDFGNWCLSAKWGTTQGDCNREYDRYQGVQELLPYAKAVSAKSYNFNDKGEDTKIDYYRMLKIVKESKYDGYIGIEYEGEILGEHEGILSTRELMEKVWNSI